MTTGVIKNVSVEKNRDGENRVRMLGVDLYIEGNTESVQLARPAGEDMNPPDDAVVYVLPAGDAYKIGFVVDDGIEPTMDKGEKKIYSLDAADIKAFINLKNNGHIELNGNDKGVARHDDTIISDAFTDATFWTWLSAAAAVLAGLGVVVPIPTALNGKINSSSDTVRTK